MADPGPSNPPASVAPAPAPTQPSQPAIPIPAPTILTHLHALLDARQSQNVSLPYLHPYAPVSAKRPKFGVGKGRGKNGAKEGTGGGEVEVIRELRAAVGVWREVLFKEREDGGRLSQSLKEVVSHQTALLPSSSSLLPFPSSSSPPSAPPLFPSSHLNSPPINLLQSLSSSVGLQTFLEDSQFGLMQTSLAIAGERIVVDVDLEVDTLTGEDDMDGGEATPLGTPGLGVGTPRKASAAFSAAAVEAAGTPASAQTNAQGSGATDERGKIKLSKLAASHVTPTGGTGQSEWIRRVLSERVEAYLELWNAAQARGAGVWEREADVKRLERELGDVEIMDEIACGPEGGEGASGDGKGKEGEVDWFDELEKIAKMVQERIAGDGNSTKLYPAEINSVFPTFKLLPDTPSFTAPNPTFRIRPAQKSLGEQVPCPFSTSSSPERIPTDNDFAMEESWIKGDWVVEYVTGSDGMDGLVVTRNWLLPPDYPGEGKDEIPVNGGVRVENLLYRSYQQSSFFSLPPQPQVFPYTASFVSVDGESGAAQHWSMAQPGPLGWVVGRVGLSKSADGFTKTIEALRRQAAMNQMFASVFRPELLRGYDVAADEGDDDEEMEEEDLLDGPQKTVPCSFELLGDSLRVSVPVVRPDGSSSPIDLVYGGRSKDPLDSAEGESEVQRLEEGDKDLVQVVAGLLRSGGGE